MLCLFFGISSVERLHIWEILDLPASIFCSADSALKTNEEIGLDCHLLSH